MIMMIINEGDLLVDGVSGFSRKYMFNKLEKWFK